MQSVPHLNQAIIDSCGKSNCVNLLGMGRQRKNLNTKENCDKILLTKQVVDTLMR
jgi:hypothetical protein